LTNKPRFGLFIAIVLKSRASTSGKFVVFTLNTFAVAPFTAPNMTLFNVFSRRTETSSTYKPVSDDEDKLLDEPTQTTKAQLEELKRANANLKRVLAVFAAFFLAFLALIAVKSWESHEDSLLFPRILNSPVPPSQQCPFYYARPDLY
jgi:hypothetical protein